MTAKEYLQQYIKAERRICVKLAEIERLTALAENVTQSFGGERVQTSSNGDSLEKTVAEIADIKAEVSRDIKTLKAVRAITKSAIERVKDEKLRDLLTYRYICGHTFEQIAVEMDYSYVHVVHNLHPKALKLMIVNSI